MKCPVGSGGDDVDVRGGADKERRKTLERMRLGSDDLMGRYHCM